MAIYHLSVQIIGRSAGRSAVAAAAYRSGERLVDERTGLTHDFSRRREEIETLVMAPAGAPEWVQDRSQLWNQAEAAEKRKDAQVAREINVAMPKELDADQQCELVRDYVGEQFVARGMVADVAIHRGNPENPHVHIMLTMREIGPEGFGPKNRDWNKPEMLEQWRSRWTELANRGLERANRAERIDHRSLEAQGIKDREPQVHVGPHAQALERQGIVTERSEINRSAQEYNAVVIDLQKAREERRELLSARGVEARIEDRLRHDWPEDAARSLAERERSAGGRPITEQELDAQKLGLSREMEGVKGEIESIRIAGVTLRTNEYWLDELQKARAEVSRHESPLGTIRRWFSPSAQNDLHHARNAVASREDQLRHFPAKSEPELQARQAEWSKQEARIPELSAKVDRLMGTYKAIDKILAGWQKDIRKERERREWEREWARQRQEREERDRGRGYERER